MELDSAVERLYTDESLAADVDDATAKPLLKWAEAQLPALIAAHSDDDAFDTAFITLKKLVKSVARLIDQRGETDETERADRAAKIQDFAAELGLTVDMSIMPNIAGFGGHEIVAQMLPAPSTSDVPAESQATSETGLPAEPRDGDAPQITVTPDDVAQTEKPTTNPLDAIYKRMAEILKPADHNEPEPPTDKE